MARLRRHPPLRPGRLHQPATASSSTSSRPGWSEVTGYDAVSFQPNAGSQGEFAGLLAIRSYHDANGDHGRRVCLIPSSAHGTNAASAVMAGMRVVVVACDDDGNVDVDDLEAKVVEHADDLAALMVTYPSTHGVFEARIREICDLVHEHGGQVYLDGANLNALVGVARPGAFGADVSHLNLHKTFCIPHGGGGPGVGPVAVRSHLAPFLPNHPLRRRRRSRHRARSDLGGAVRLGRHPAHLVGLRAYDGRRRPDRGHPDRHPGANYVAARLEDSVTRCSTRGEHGRVAHECIVDIRDITRRTGVTVDDVAKRLIDYGFHAPTMSFPVAGTLMIEPTESESLAELDRFCDAMMAIADEIAEIERGEIDHDDSALANAPHTGRGSPGRRLGPSVLPGARRLPGARAAPRQVLAAGEPHRRRRRRPQPGVRLPTPRGLPGLRRSLALTTSPGANHRSGSSIVGSGGGRLA